MNTRQGLVVLEYPYLYAGWKVDTLEPLHAVSTRKGFSAGRRALEDYRLCGVYGKAGFPMRL